MISQAELEGSVGGKFAGDINPQTGNFIQGRVQEPNQTANTHHAAFQDWPDSPIISEGFCPTETRVRDLRAGQAAPQDS